MALSEDSEGTVTVITFQPSTVVATNRWVRLAVFHAKHRRVLRQVVSYPDTTQSRRIILPLPSNDYLGITLVVPSSCMSRWSATFWVRLG